MALSKVIEFLVRGKCTPEYATSMCCMEDDVVVLKYLHEANYPLNKDTFYMCIKHDSIKCLEFLISNQCPYGENSYIVALENEPIFTLLKKIHADPKKFKYEISDVPNIYSVDLFKLMIQKDKLNILKCYNLPYCRMDDSDDECDDECGTMFMDECYDIFCEILKYERTDVLNWVYNDSKLHSNVISHGLTRLINYCLTDDGKYMYLYLTDSCLEYFLKWIQSRQFKYCDYRISYDNLFTEFDGSINKIINVANIFHKYDVPIEINIESLTNAYNRYKQPTDCKTDYNLDRVIEWIVNHDVKIKYTDVLRWVSNKAHKSLIGIVCKNQKETLLQFVDYCIRSSNVYILQYLHHIGLEIPRNMCDKAVDKNSIAVLSWAYYSNFPCNSATIASTAIKTNKKLVLEFCIGLKYKITINDIRNKLLINFDMEMFKYMIGKSDHLESDVLTCIEFDNLECLIKILDFNNVIKPVYGGLFGIRLVNYNFINSIIHNIAQYNSVKICRYVLDLPCYKISGRHLIKDNGQFHENCIINDSFDVLKLVGLYSPVVFSSDYYMGLIRLALKLRRYDIVKWINESK